MMRRPQWMYPGPRLPLPWRWRYETDTLKVLGDVPFSLWRPSGDYSIEIISWIIGALRLYGFSNWEIFPPSSPIPENVTLICKHLNLGELVLAIPWANSFWLLIQINSSYYILVAGDFDYPNRLPFFRALKIWRSRTNFKVCLKIAVKGPEK